MSLITWTRTTRSVDSHMEDPYIDTTVVRLCALDTYTVSQAAARTGWSARMLRYLESTGLVVPERSAAGYRRYGDHDLGLLRGLQELRKRFGVELADVAFVVRLRRDPMM